MSTVIVEDQPVQELIELYSSTFDYEIPETAVILAAGHGKRIKSHRSKMLHQIWGLPTVERVYNACRNGIEKINMIVVVGIKAPDVIKVIGNRKNTLFANQQIQNGTGHAVQVGLSNVDSNRYSGIVYVLPGDMGLIDSDTMRMFREEFIKSNCDMMVLTGKFEGDSGLNNYGRIIRVKNTDRYGNPAGEDEGKVVEIKEHKDILSLDKSEPFIVQFNGREYAYTRDELIENREYNSGVFAFNYDKLNELINTLTNDNVQGEIYITDLISAFNSKGYNVGAVSPTQQHVIMGFNNKSVLKQMEAIARNLAYNKVKDLIEIEDPDDFFIEESVIDDIVELDKQGIPLDIKIGRGVYIGKGVKLNYNLVLKKNVYVAGNVVFGKNVTIWENVLLSCYPNQRFKIGDNVEILWGDIIKGNIIIGDDSRIESSVNMTGSDEFPLRIGRNVIIKGTSYIFGSIIDDDIFIEHSVLIKKRVDRIMKKNGEIQQIKFVLPMPEGLDACEDL
jgi:bifunctional UDP-N-acetylglucosamine pyrophosphorylase/glucosamine-1-phosphate N-acetyltransferase